MPAELRLGQDGAMTERKLVPAGTVWEARVGYSRAVRVGQEFFGLLSH